MTGHINAGMGRVGIVGKMADSQSWMHQSLVYEV